VPAGDHHAERVCKQVAAPEPIRWSVPGTERLYNDSDIDGARVQVGDRVVGLEHRQVERYLGKMPLEGS
jgi:hypothetical protein